MLMYDSYHIIAIVMPYANALVPSPFTALFTDLLPSNPNYLVRFPTTMSTLVNHNSNDYV